MPGARRRDRGLQRARRAGHRRGRRARDHRPDAIHADRPMERPRRESATARATSRSTPASGATVTGSRSPAAAPPSSTDARTRRSTAAAFAWAPARSTAQSSHSRRSSEAIVVDADGWMPLFVVLAPGADLDDELRGRIGRQIRQDCSPRHVPNDVFAITEIPRTVTGKPLEVPIKRILLGTPPEKAVSRGALANPQALEYFIDLARSRQTPHVLPR